MNFDISSYSTHFIDESICVAYISQPVLEKKPRCPDSFIWRGETLIIQEQIMEWVDYSRRGRMARNMSDAHSTFAAIKGSWGVGRFFFRILTSNGRFFDIYYDRAPKGLENRKGTWTLFQEFTPKDKSDL